MSKPIDLIATIGPACSDIATITAMIEAGMTMARLNFSWGTYAEHTQFITLIRTAAASLGVTVPIIQDVSGPRVQAAHGHSFAVAESVLTVKDKESIQAMNEHGVEYIAQSYVGGVSDVTDLRTFLHSIGSTAKIIAKIERQEAIDSIGDIIRSVDGIMIARGDLGDAIPYYRVPFVQKDILAQCSQVDRPVIVATEMLSSMLTTTRPSRADVSDIAQAVLDGATMTMLSNETAVGSNPVLAVQTMRTIIDEARRERDLHKTV